MPVYRSLHLSDLHIGGTYLDSQELAYKITNDIARTGIGGIRNILVTGDIFHGPAGTDKALILEASRFFQTLMDELNEDGRTTGLTRDNFLFVPGNHDIVWTEDKPAQWDKYRRFLEEFYGTVPGWYDPMDFSFCYPCPEDKLVFLGFNSCGLKKRKLHDDLIRCCEEIKEKQYLSHGISKDQLMKLLEQENPEEYADYGEITMRQLSRQRRKMESLDGYQAVAMFHHHFFLFPDNPNQLGDSDVVQQHATLVRALRSMRVKTILHGHKHFDLERPFINDDYYETADSIIDVFAGGSVGAQGLQQHTFSVIDFYPEHDPVKLRQQKFIYREDALAPIKTIQIPPVSKAAQVVRLPELLKNHNHDAYEAYQAIIMSNSHLYRACGNILEWTGNALTGYPEVYRYLDRDGPHLLCLLYAIARRALAYISLHSPDRGSSLAAARGQLDRFFTERLASSVPEHYERLFDASGLNQAAKLCAELMDKQVSYPQNQFLAFTMAGIFFTDLNLVLTEYADDFYHQISHKVNIKLEPNHFHSHVPAPRISIQSDADRRSAYVKMWCNDATAHKLAVLFVKEFDLSINKFEDFFQLIHLKLYYLLPQIEKDAALDTLDNYNFEAYIPTLLPLLIGDNIYHSKEVFARELVQNAIDAISVREALEGRLADEDRVIRIFLGRNKSGRNIFRITDHGTGMDRYKVERYFTSIGRSFYSGEDYEELNISYKPISSFGIGFLSSFMVCKEIDVRTRSFDGEMEGLKLHIPNYEGCFFIERAEGVETGTEITLYLDHMELNRLQIAHYLQHSMQDIKYPIELQMERRTPLCIPAHQIRRDRPLCLFIPLLPDGTVGRLNWERDVLSGSFIEENDYGLLIDLDCWSSDGLVSILNAGIATNPRIQTYSLFDRKTNEFLFSRHRFSRVPYREHCFNRFTFNFPSNWIQLDVSREKVVGFSAWMETQHKDSNASLYLQNNLARALREQLTDLLRHCRQDKVRITAACVAELHDFLQALSSHSDSTFSRHLMTSTYSCQIVFTNRGISYEVSPGRPESDFSALENLKESRQAYAALDGKLKAPVDGTRSKTNIPYIMDILEQSAHLLRQKTSHYEGAFGYPMSPEQDELLLLGWSTVSVLSVIQDSELSPMLHTNKPYHSEAAEKLGVRYHDWKRCVQNILLCCTTAGAAERGEAKLFVSYEDLIRTDLTSLLRGGTKQKASD